MICAALFFTACCGAPEVTETKTAVAHGDEIALVAPPKTGGVTVNEALWARSSWREYSPEVLTLEELSGVVWAAAGINRPDDGKLTAPSAMALYPVRVYAVFAEGIYFYDAVDNELLRLVEGDYRSLAGSQPFVHTAPLNLLYIADVSKYDGMTIPVERINYFCGLDAAGYAENVNIYTAGHGLKSITRGAGAADELLELLGLDAGRYVHVLSQTVGK